LLSRCTTRVSRHRTKEKANGSGRNRGLLELDLKLDDLLEMQKDSQEDLDLEYVQFNVTKVLNLLNRRFARKKGW
jgi:Ras GTPase-activating-like protein IQGAP2/3